MRVGTSDYAQKADTQARDHPHACGDKAFRKGKTLVGLGSSPCVWGQDYVLGKLWRKHRIIPMRVGTSILHKSWHGEPPRIIPMRVGTRKY